jgi:hypothetical protein
MTGGPARAARPRAPAYPARVADDPSSAPPAGAGVVTGWLRDLFAERPPPGLWSVLDEPLRLALAQDWIWDRGYVDDHAAHALAEARPEHDEFAELSGALVTRWRDRYAGLRGDRRVVGGTRVLGVDLELVLVTGGGGAADGDAPPRPFVTRYTAGGWLIAATGRHLPVPGWPPSEEEPPA